jgi:hypothetical protein
MTDNLALWKTVERTPKEHTKAITGKAYKGTSPNPHYLIHKATETFGPCGIGWGFNILSERIADGSEGTKIHIAHVRVWYKWNGETGEVEHMGQTVFAGKNKNGPFTDEDAPKKSVTDALVKAMSMIGFAGDIFMGRYDDSKYVAALNEHDEPESPPESHLACERAVTAKFLAAPTVAALDAEWKAAAQSMNAVGLTTDDDIFQAIIAKFRECKIALQERDNHKAAAE